MSLTRRHLLTCGMYAPLSAPMLGVLPAQAQTPGQAPAQDGAGAPPANPHPLQRFLGAPRLVGQGKYTYWGFEVYLARLWRGEAALKADQWHTQRLALELRYLRDFAGKDIAQRSIDEMQQQSPLPSDKARAWLKTLENLFPNVRKGQSLTGVYVPDGEATFLFNDKPLGNLSDAELSKRFFAIWLAPQTSAPQLRQQLFADTL